MKAAIGLLYDLHASPLGAGLLVVYTMIIGGAVGSFLNVVAHRLPLGMSLSRPGSRCPRCERPIRWYHNVPVFGWLILRGHCRDCGAPISPRYPLVELLVAVASGSVCWSALDPLFADDEFVYSINLLAVGLRLILVYSLFCVALLEFDGRRLPLRLLSVVFVFAALGMYLVPELRPTQHLSEQPVPSLKQMFFPIFGALLFGLLSWPLLMLLPSTVPTDAITGLLAIMLIGLIMGGMAVMFAGPFAATVLVAAVWLAHFWPPASRIGWASALLIATLFWMLLAGPYIGSNRLLVVGMSIFTVETPWPTLVALGTVVAMESLLGRAIYAVSNRPPRPSTK